MSSEDQTTRGTSSSTFQYTPIEQWSKEQVLEWLRAVCNDNRIDSGNLVGFAECTGRQLQEMTVSQFMELNPLHGQLFCNKFLEYTMFRARQSEYRRHYTPQQTPQAEYVIQNTASGSTYHELLPRAPGAVAATTTTTYPCHYSHWEELPYHGNVCSSDPCSYPSDGPLPHTPTSMDAGFSGNTLGYQGMYNVPLDYNTSVPPQSYQPMPQHSMQSPPPSLHVPPHAESRRDRGPKLWEFLLDLLEDPESNPGIIRWENVDEDTFRLTSPHEVAYRWGQRRPSQNKLPYDYFARALRYHYRTGKLVSVPERKLVYKFGPGVRQRQSGGANPIQ